MTDRPLVTTLRRVVPHALVGFSVFVLTLVLTLGDAPMAAPSTYGNPLFADALSAGLGDGKGTLVLLAAAFAAIVTLDLAFVRHVVSTYAHPRRATRKGVQRTGSENRS